ncbi:MAG: hypothetical protein ACTSQ8_22980 [Candidatus Helarchaeota archaeon]
MDKLGFKSNFRLINLIIYLFVAVSVVSIIFIVILLFLGARTIAIVAAIILFIIFILLLLFLYLQYSFDVTTKEKKSLKDNPEKINAEIQYLKELILNNNDEISYLKNELEEFESQLTTELDEKIRDQQQDIDNERNVKTTQIARIKDQNNEYWKKIHDLEISYETTIQRINDHEKINFQSFMLTSSNFLTDTKGRLAVIISFLVYICVPLSFIGVLASSFSIDSKRSSIQDLPPFFDLSTEQYAQTTNALSSTLAHIITPTNTVSGTKTSTETPSPTISLSPTITASPTITPSPSVSPTPTNSRTPTPTRTHTSTRTSTPTKTKTPRPTDTRWNTATPGPTSPPPQPPPPQPTQPPPPQPPPPEPTQGGNCCHCYPYVCIPYPPPDLDCADIPYKRFAVVGCDPHGFDGDNDGIGCEW